MVLQALADRPDALLDLDRLVTRLRRTEKGRQVLPQGFDDFWAEAMAALDTMDGQP